MSNYTHCSHGVSYDDECAKCEALWVKEVTLPQIIKNAKSAARVAVNCPEGVTEGVASYIAGLNFAVASLAELLEAKLKEPK